ncbi:MAG: hypothetical protein PHX13_02065 [Thiovulaceae bacterium]|nr:hypothetical protein [Sulfurimonadaceae bacterium]
MLDTICLPIIQAVIDSQKDLVVIFHQQNHIATNKAFNKFFDVRTFEEYNNNFGPIVDNFVPHPSYFHKEKLQEGENWFDAIGKLEEIDRIVSILTQTYEPCAFSVKIDSSVQDYKIVTFVDITRDLVKRIMIENNINIDKKSGAYDKKYFLQIGKNFEEAAVFNEKMIGMNLVTVDEEANPDFSHDDNALREFVKKFKSSIRQDDMLVRWGPSKFLLVYLIDSEQNAGQVAIKLQNLLKGMSGLNSTLSSVLQQKGENISALIKRVHA